jgi:hypothetical protein
MKTRRTAFGLAVTLTALSLALLAAPAAQACSGYCNYATGCGVCSFAGGWTGMACEQWAPCGCSELLCIASVQPPESTPASDAVLDLESSEQSCGQPAQAQGGICPASPVPVLSL